MILANWPPSRGPKPPEMQIILEKFEPAPAHCTRIKFKQSKDCVEERKELVEAALEIKHKELLGEPAKLPRKLSRPITERVYVERDFKLDHHVSTVAGLSLEQAVRMIAGVGARSKRLAYELPRKAVTIDITYPLTQGVRMRIYPYTLTQEYGDGSSVEMEYMDIGYVLWMIAREYQHIYANWKNYAVWGHEIDDLVLERITFDHRRGRAKLEVGG
jgi:hypothetical protein